MYELLYDMPRVSEVMYSYDMDDTANMAVCVYAYEAACRDALYPCCLSRLGDEGVRQILKSLLKNTTLTSLNLSANNLGESSAQSLSEVFVGNKTLTVLDLSSNGFGEVQ